MNYKPLESVIGYTFKETKILKKALTHASKAPEHLERQEFLGDAVLGLVVSEYLYQHYPSSDEGDLSKMRANLVCKTALFEIATLWGLADFLEVGDGERTKQGKLKSESIAANAVEAVVGAVFLDAGWSEANKLVLSSWGDMLKHVEPINLRDPKSELQELTQANSMGLPQYKITDFGVDASPRFKADCYIQEKMQGSGQGNRKKLAELKAAMSVLKNKSSLGLT